MVYHMPTVGYRSGTEDFEQPSYYAASDRFGSQLVSLYPAIAAVVSTLLLGGFLFFLISRSWVPTPHWDQWDYEGETLIRYFGHDLSWRYLFSQHNESRLFVPRVVAIVLAPLTGWDIRYDVGLTLFCTLWSAIGLDILVLRSSLLRPHQKVFCLVCANAAVFSCTQWEVLLFGAYYFVVPGMALIWSLVVMQGRWSYAAKVFTSVALSVVATLSYINGLFLCVLLFPALVIEGQRAGLSMVRRRSLQATYLVLSALTVLPYLRTYKQHAGHPSMEVTLVEPARMFQYYLSWIGAPLTDISSRDVVAQFAGGALLILFFSAGGYLIWVHRKNIAAAQAYCWIVIGSYVAITGLSVTVGRSAMGVGQAFASRYQTFSLLLPAVLAPLAFLAINRRFPDAIQRYRWTAAFCFVTGGAAALFSLGYDSGSLDLQKYSFARSEAALGIEFVDAIPDNPLLVIAYPAPARIIQVRRALAPYHLPRISDEAGRILRSARSVSTNGDPANGSFESATDAGNGAIHVLGWAEIPHQKAKPAAAVLFEWKGSDGSVKPIAVLPVGSARPEVAQAKSNADLANSGFSGDISKNTIPGSGVLSAWAVDGDEDVAYQLANTKPVTR